jgi:hypothetical protein
MGSGVGHFQRYPIAVAQSEFEKFSPSTTAPQGSKRYVFLSFPILNTIGIVPDLTWWSYPSLLFKTGIVNSSAQTTTMFRPEVMLSLFLYFLANCTLFI